MVDQQATIAEAALLLQSHGVADNLTWLVDGPFRTGLYQADGVEFDLACRVISTPKPDAALRFSFKGKAFEIRTLSRHADQGGNTYSSELLLSVDSVQVLVARLESRYEYFGWKRAVSIDPADFNQVVTGAWMEDLRAIVEVCCAAWEPKQQRLEAIGLFSPTNAFDLAADKAH